MCDVDAYVLLRCCARDPLELMRSILSLIGESLEGRSTDLCRQHLSRQMLRSEPIQASLLPPSKEVAPSSFERTRRRNRRRPGSVTFVPPLSALWGPLSPQPNAVKPISWLTQRGVFFTSVLSSQTGLSEEPALACWTPSYWQVGLTQLSEPRITDSLCQTLRLQRQWLLSVCELLVYLTDSARVNLSCFWCILYIRSICLTFKQKKNKAWDIYCTYTTKQWDCNGKCEKPLVLRMLKVID